MQIDVQLVALQEHVNNISSSQNASNVQRRILDETTPLENPTALIVDRNICFV